jgi:predicted RNase H-like HicB family nuclease
MSHATLVRARDLPDEQPVPRLRLVGEADPADEYGAVRPQSASGGPTDGGERSLRFTAALLREAGWFVARALEVDVVSQGNSIEEALANLGEAIELYFQVETPPATVDAPIIASIDVTVPA